MYYSKVNCSIGGDMAREVNSLYLNNNDSLKDLYKKIKTTRYSRIRAEERIIRKSKLVMLLNVWFSCCIVVFTVISLFNNDKILGILSLVMSIFLLGFIVYYSSQNYSERAYKMRMNYVELEKLELELKKYIDDKDKILKKIENKEYEKIMNGYLILLNQCENHSLFDYYNAAHLYSFTNNNVINDKNKNDKYKSKKTLNERVLKYTIEMKHRRFYG